MDEKMQLSEIGNIANQCWIDIPKHFPFVRLGDYVVMPDHVHGILIIDKTGYNAGPKNKTAVMDIPETRAGLATPTIQKQIRTTITESAIHRTGL